jgi:hypothetical protein
MEAVNSFVMAWWPVIAGLMVCILWAAQAWVHGQMAVITAALGKSSAQMELLISRVEAQDNQLIAQSGRINQLTDALNLFQMEALKNFVTEKDIDRLTDSVNGLKVDLSAWLTRIEAQIERK